MWGLILVMAVGLPAEACIEQTIAQCTASEMITLEKDSFEKLRAKVGEYRKSGSAKEVVVEQVELFANQHGGKVCSRHIDEVETSVKEMLKLGKKAAKSAESAKTRSEIQVILDKFGAEHAP